MSHQDQQAVPLATTPNRRFYPRTVPQRPIFFALNENEPEKCRLLNVSENGLLVSMPTSLPSDFIIRISIPLNGLPKAVQVTARVAWASNTRKLAGIQLLDLSEHDREEIRKWSALQSPPAPERESAHPSPNATASASSPEVSDFIPAFSPGTRLSIPVSTPPDIAALAFPPPVRARATSDVDRRAIRLMLIAMACLVAAVVVIKAAPSNPFAGSTETPSEAIATSPPAQDSQAAPQTPYISDHASAPQAVPSVPITRPRSTLPLQATSSRHNSSKMAEDPRKTTRDENSASTQSELSLSAAVPVPSETIHESASPQSPVLAEVPKAVTSQTEAPLSPDLPTPRQPVPSRTNDVAVPSAGVGPTVVPQNKTLEVHLPSGRSGSLSLPGERLIESPSLTMHIQRSILMPPARAVWPFRRDRKVVVGQLISHAEPEFAQPRSGPAVSLCVKATIAKDGHVENVKQILGPPRLAPAVVKALQEWRYQPTLVDGKPVDTQCYVTFQFRSTTYRAARR